MLRADGVNRATVTFEKTARLLRITLQNQASTVAGQVGMALDKLVLGQSKKNRQALDIPIRQPHLARNTAALPTTAATEPRHLLVQIHECGPRRCAGSMLERGGASTPLPPFHLKLRGGPNQ